MRTRNSPPIYKPRKIPVPGNWPTDFEMVRKATAAALPWEMFSETCRWKDAGQLRAIPQSLVDNGQFKKEDVCWLIGPQGITVGVRRTAMGRRAK